MQRPLLLLALLAIVAMTNAQHHALHRWLDASLNITTKGNSKYAATVTHEADGWVLRATHSNGKPLLLTTFKKRILTVKDGPYTIYYINGRPRQSGTFVNNTPDGIWQSWYENGQLRDSGRVLLNNFAGIWKHWYAGGRLKSIQHYTTPWHTLPPDPDPEPPPQWQPDWMPDIPVIKPAMASLHLGGTRNGPWQTWYENGMLESTGNYQNDLLEGEWKWFRPNGKPCTVEVYAANKLTKLNCYDENGQFTGNTCAISKYPAFLHPLYTYGMHNLRDYISKQLKEIYNLDINVAGPARIRFVVTAGGKAEQLSVYAPRSDTLVNDITRIFTTLPAFHRRLRTIVLLMCR
jgi:antitoxin component YwqK of YwqJK toxin-antitoxin module